MNRFIQRAQLLVQTVPRALIYSFVAFILAFGPVFTLLTPVQAAGVQVTITSPTNGEFNALTATDVTVHYVASASQFANANTITFSVNPALPNALTNCTSATTDADGDTTTDGSLGSFTTSGAVYTFSAATTTAATTGINICLRFPASTTTGIYSIALTDNNDSDNGAALVYVGDDNDVDVNASVSASLAFAIRNTADTADTNVCALGALTIATVNTCAYRLKVTTNSTTGYQVQITSDGDLRLSGTGDVADALDIDQIGEATVASGTEGYGIALTAGAATTGTITEQGNFATDDSSIPFTATNLYNSNGANAPSATDTTNTALVTHRAAIDGGTATGNYTQRVTYYVTAAF